MTLRSNRILVAGLLLVILASGVAIGVAMDRLWLRPEAAAGVDGDRQRGRGHRGDRTERLVDRFQRKLQLGADQTREVRQALQSMFTRMRAIREKSREDVDEVRQETRLRIIRTLSPEQQRKYRRMIERYERRRAERRRRRHKKH